MTQKKSTNTSLLGSSDRTSLSGINRLPVVQSPEVVFRWASVGRKALAIIWFTDEDRERMRRENAELAGIGAEYDRICFKYARLASREPSPINWDKISQLDISRGSTGRTRTATLPAGGQPKVGETSASIQNRLR